jgi:hypothetical protein
MVRGNAYTQYINVWKCLHVYVIDVVRNVNGVKVLDGLGQ